MKDKLDLKNETPTFGNVLLGAVLFKEVKYKITILGCENAHLIPIELRSDFISWLKSKAIELGLGKHCEHYYDHDESGNTWVEVLFSVHCA